MKNATRRWAWVSLVVLAVAAAAAAQTGTAPGKAVKVYLMAGQSNMVGPGSVKYVQENHPELMAPRADVWCVDAGKISGPLKPGYGGREHNFGLELTMGHILGDAVDNPIVLFKSSTGGTTLHKNWRPPSAVKRAGGEVGPLYTRMMRRFHAMLANRDEAFPAFKGRPIELAGFVWFQGENDCCAKDENGKGYWLYYEENLKDLIKDVRRELGVPKLPVLIVQINDSCWDGKVLADGTLSKGGTFLRPVQAKVAEADPLATWIKTCDLNDGYHYDSASHIIIGRRAGEALLPFIRKTVPQNASDVLAARERFFAQFPRAETVDTTGLAKGLVGYWSFDEGEGATTADRSGNQFSGELVGQPTWTHGRLGKAVRLVAGQSIVFPKFREPVNAEKRIETLSVSYWLRTNRYGDGYVGRSAGDENYGQNRHNWFVNPWAVNGGWAVGCHDVDGNPYATATFDMSPNSIHARAGDKVAVGDGFEWHHIVMVYDGGRKTFEMYVDGNSVDKARSRTGLKGLAEENHIVPARRAKLTLGGHITLDGHHQVFDELAIWHRPITAAEARTLYNNGHGAEITLPERPATASKRKKGK